MIRNQACREARFYCRKRSIPESKMDISCLRGEYVFAVNLFTIHSEFNYFRNCFYCLGDPRFYQKWAVAFGRSAKISLHRHAGVTSFFENSARACCHPILKEREMEENCNVFFVEIDSERKNAGRAGSMQILKRNSAGGIPWSLINALPIAIYMGFNPIYLIGCDCDYGLDTDSFTDFRNAYFYDPEN